MRSTKLAVLYCTVDITGSTNRKGSNRPFRSREADSRRSNGRDVGVVSPSKPRVRCSGQRTAKDEFTGRTGSLAWISTGPDLPNMVLGQTAHFRALSLRNYYAKWCADSPIAQRLLAQR